MKSFDEISYEPPPYPAFKAYFIPYREEDKIMDCRKVEDKDVKLWREVLSNLRSFLKDSLKIAKQNLSITERFELIADLIALFFRIPLLREPLPQVAPSPLKAYLLNRLQPVGEIDVDPLEFVTRSLEKLRERGEILSLIEPQLYERTERCWFIFPADTRPAFNTSGLIPHLLLTSALSWAIAIQKHRLGREEAALLRLAAMLHDMGKPFKYHKHVEASREIAEILLEPILPKGEFDRVLNFISTHHIEARTLEGKILKKADGIASNLDRMREIAEEYIGENLRELAERYGLRFEDAYSHGKESWEFWSNLYEKAGEIVIENLSKKFVKAIRKETKNYTTIPGRLIETNRKPVDGIKLFMIDMGGIQKFIRRAVELKCVVASSIIIDTIIMTQIPLLIQIKTLEDGVWLPYDAFIYSAGGIVELLIPDRIKNRVMKSIDELKSKTILQGLPLRYPDPITLSTSFTYTARKLAERMQLKKNIIEDERMGIAKVKAAELCGICYLEPAAPNLRVEDKNVCETCYKLYWIGMELHFKNRYNKELFINPDLRRKPSDVFKLPWESISEYVMEIVAGHDEKEIKALEEGVVERRDVAAIKVDGNLIGAFMATCLSPTDVYERSARIDLSLKRAMEKALQALYDGVKAASLSDDEAAKAVISVKLGILYAGGDDAALLSPAWASSVIALILGEEFKRNLGDARGLSIGVAAASAKANVWGLLDAAHELMDKAKSEGRRRLDESFVAFDLIPTGSFSRVSAKARFEMLRKRRLTSQPLAVDACEGRSLSKLLSLILGDYTDYEELFERSYLTSRAEDLPPEGLSARVDEAKRRVRGIREVIGRTMKTVEGLTSDRVGESWELSLLAAHIFARRQITRLGKEAEAYRCVREFLPRRFGEPSQLSDADRLIQILGGGVL